MPLRVLNVQQGWTEKRGSRLVFHPIRHSGDYDPTALSGAEGKRARARVTRKKRKKAKAKRRNARSPYLGAESDPTTARELELFIENDATLYRSQHTPIIKNLATKKAKGVYRHDLAVKLFRYLVDRADKMYHGSRDVQSSTATRNEVADSLARSFETEYDLGNYKHLLPKKYQQNRRGRGRNPGASRIPLPGLRDWNMYAGGTSAAPGKHSYDVREGGKQYMIDPISSEYGRHQGYQLKVFPGEHGGYHWIGGMNHLFRSPQAAVTAAKKYHMQH